MTGRDRRVPAALMAAMLVAGCSSAPRPSPPVHSSSAQRSPAGGAHTDIVDGESVLAERFDGAAGTAPDPAVFNLRVGGNGWGNRELETYTSRPGNAALDGHGHLVIQAVRERFTGDDGITRQWTSARMDTLDKWSFTTGTVAARMKVPAGQGLWPAFWLIGANVVQVGWPDCGEIDVAETIGTAPMAFQTLHGPDSRGHPYQVSVKSRPRTGSYADTFHVFAVTRSPGSITFAVDGHQTARITRDHLGRGQKWVFDGPMVVVLNLAVGGNWPGPTNRATPAHANLVVDWITYRP